MPSSRSFLRVVVFCAALAVARLAAAAPPTIVTFHDDGFGSITVQPGTDPASAGLTLTVDLRPIGGGIREPYVDEGLVCDDDTRDFRFYPCFTPPLYVAPGTYTLTWTVADAQGRSSTASRSVTYTAPPDTDGDGLPDTWETMFGFNPSVAGEANLDPDGDGATNLQELAARTHPRGTFTRYFAEGVSNAYFASRFDLFNPSAAPVLVLVRMQASDGAQSTVARVVPPFSTAGPVQSSVPGNDFSVVVESDGLVVAERTTEWSAAARSLFRSTFGSHAETAIASPATSWYLAEGATHGGFDLFYLIQNPGGTAASVTVEYLRPTPLPPISRTYSVAPHSRRTIYVDEESPELAATDVSATFTSDAPVVVERAMYFSTPDQVFTAGHAGAAVAAPATSWYLAEGAGGFFDTFILLANPGSTAATVTLTFLPGGGHQPPIVRTHTVAARSRLTVNPQQPSGLFPTFGTVVSSTAPIVVERAVWWPSGAPWREAHLVSGATALATRWALAALDTVSGSYAGGPTPAPAESYVLIANPAATDTTVTLRSGPNAVTYPLVGQSRMTLPVSVVMSHLLGTPGQGVSGSFPLVVESGGPPIVVERASYSDYAGVAWASGSALLATPLP